MYLYAGIAGGADGVVGVKVGAAIDTDGVSIVVLASSGLKCHILHLYSNGADCGYVCG
jgi:hypothetical protein